MSNKSFEYTWKLREKMAERQMFSTTDLRPLLLEHGITLSASQVYRLVAERPERINLNILIALLAILDCSFEDIVEVTNVGQGKLQATGTNISAKTPSATDAIGDFRPKRARINP